MLWMVFHQNGLLVISPHDNNLQKQMAALQWRHIERNGVSNHQPHDCLLNQLFKAQIKENIKTPRQWPLRGEFTDDRWIPRTKVQ